METWH